MLETNNKKFLLSNTAQKSIGGFCEFGCSMYGKTYYGKEPVVIEFEDGKILEISGVYQKRKSKKGTFIVKERFYFPKNPRTESQQAVRQNIRNAVVFWQDLTSNEKAQYNERAKGKNFSGYNLFIREYILSL